MAYKIYSKKLSAYEKKLKQARHDRRKAKQERVRMLEEITEEQIAEALKTVFGKINSQIKLILERDCPEGLPLMGIDWLQTVKHFSEADMTDTLRKAMYQCTEELGELVGISLLSLITKPEHILSPKDKPLLSESRQSVA